MTQDVAAVLFDRDGTLIGDVPYDGVVSNQSGVGRGCRKPAPGMAAGVRTVLVPTRHTRSLLGTGRA